jgi:hypothetical protein
MDCKRGFSRRLNKALGLVGGDAGGDGFGQVAPAVDLLHGSDKDALAGGQQLERGKVEVGDVAQAAFRVGKKAQDLVVVHIGDAGVLGLGAEDDDELDRLCRERQLSLTAPVGDSFTDALRSRHIANLHACFGKLFQRRKSAPLFHRPGARLRANPQPRQGCPVYKSRPAQ